MYREITVGELIELLKMFPEDSKVSSIEGDDEYLWVGGIAIELYVDNPTTDYVVEVDNDL